MYLVYDTNQTTFGRRKLISWRDIGSFRPTWLVRVSDMQRVKGSIAPSGYCALSYSWNYSGDIVEHQNGKSTCEDKGLHKIIKHNWNPERPNHDEVTVTEVRFEVVIQEICRSFGIDYIWYDKACIDQHDEKSKQDEINQMHNIYKNALFTVALIPELNPLASSSPQSSKFQHDPYDGYCFQQILGSEWCKRMWTLEEAVLSRNMVFVGQAAHFWSYQMTELFFYGRRDDHQRLHPLIEELCTARKEACKVLYFAHRRTSTKEHDKVFALANIFADTIQIKSNYSLEIQTVLQEFYCNLAKEDLTILYFGQPLVNYPSTMREYTFLPSWTGIAGIHVLEIHLTHLQVPKPVCSVVNQRSFRITCEYITVTPEELPNGTQNEIHDLQTSFNIEITHSITKRAKECALFEEYHPIAFMSLTNTYVQQQECQVLNIPFNVYRRHGIFHPVIQQDKISGTCKSIGVFIIHLRVPSVDIHVPLNRFGDLRSNGTFHIE